MKGVLSFCKKDFAIICMYSIDCLDSCFSSSLGKLSSQHTHTVRGYLLNIPGKGCNNVRFHMSFKWLLPDTGLFLLKL